ncbi:conserved Plasmodium protein, unknown function [Plasmodium knowlesi strain H]|uniref:Uncharacterized protein n=3 Tax=Plasmodium knowlesi TaxID=5850 RepID=A0A5K1U3R6_PLAKH|nr:conserved Plasmodium protein, unknown function [Plasmodium knowlesi strain H]OTN63782.1 Uncharacterized protein PKNOH_S140254000 [Plasmodium knowlesi]CAA9990957.1 conserved Plasmodium protein, unknown function [Plasmodium knowlesi strain H]SBO20818.1 conserved Plasmodium protein, unknown function [Plasmodium knowlesi strain H]SBO21242.1 conserved Plasmodium protein, unknown function [Plasmodium knowlesi strain H]VVS80431.1 conserved Plasmodium protein, unknown function [Plasmodium knowlesi |eukprot:XP_002262240.1 hypothetical protein, conserved in Plasmodium species [Plasmodium knowlesi strain H]
MFKRSLIFLVISIFSIALVVYKRVKHESVNGEYYNVGGNIGGAGGRSPWGGAHECSLSGEICTMDYSDIGTEQDEYKIVHYKGTRINKVKKGFKQIFQPFFKEMKCKKNSKHIISLFLEFFENSKVFLTVFLRSSYHMLYAYGILLISFLKILFLWYIILEPYMQWLLLKLKIMYVNLDQKTKKYVVTMLCTFLSVLYLIHSGVIKYILNKISKFYIYLLRKVFRINKFLFNILPYLLSSLLYVTLVKTLPMSFISFFIYSIFFPLPSIYSVIIILKYVYPSKISEYLADSVTEKLNSSKYVNAMSQYVILRDGELVEEDQVEKAGEGGETNEVEKANGGEKAIEAEKANGEEKVIEEEKANGEEKVNGVEKADEVEKENDHTETELKTDELKDNHPSGSKKKKFSLISLENFVFKSRKKDRSGKVTENENQDEGEMADPPASKRKQSSICESVGEPKGEGENRDSHYDVPILLEYWLFINILKFLNFFFFFRNYSKTSFMFEYFTLFVICLNVSEKLHEFVFLKDYKSSILVRILKSVLVSTVDFVLYTLFNVRLENEGKKGNKSVEQDMQNNERSNLLINLSKIVKDKLKLNETVKFSLTCLKSVIMENVVESVQVPFYIKIFINLLLYMPQLILLIFPSFILKIYFAYFFFIFPIFGSLKCLEEKNSIHNKIYFICYFFFYNIASATVNHAFFKCLPFYNLYKIIITISVQTILKYIFNVIQVKS